jgi:ABC-type antimicrobial peptide transport system permease subunit
VEVVIRPLSHDVARSLRQERLLGAFGVTFATVAVLLAAIGLYGLMSHVVTRRRTEFGIRLALGAGRLHIIRLVTARVVGLLIAGSVAGGLMSFWLSAYIQTLLYGVGQFELTTFVAAAAVLATAGLIASWGPARDVLRLDPAEILRDR